MKYFSRRKFLAGIAGAGSLYVSGFPEIVEKQFKKRQRRLARDPWPRAKPDTVPSLDSLQTLPVPSIGDPDGIPVTVYQDFGTMMSGKFFHEELPTIRDAAMEGHIEIRYRDHPIPSMDWSYPIAIAARSVQAQRGNAAFWEFSKLVNPDYRPYPLYTKEQVESAADSVGASVETVVRDVESWKYYERIQQDLEQAKQFDFNSVPNTVIGEGEDQFHTAGVSGGSIIGLIEIKIGPIGAPDDLTPSNA